MIVQHLELKNFKNIKDFKESFEGKVYLVTGENEIGKTTLLGAIASLLTGERSANLLSQKEKKGFAKIKVGEDQKELYDVELKFSEKNPRGTLRITDPNGMASDKKSMLQKIFRYQDFDANEFVSWSNTADGRRKQVDLVKSLLPVDVVTKMLSLDKKIIEVKEKRKEFNIRQKTEANLVDEYKVSEDQIKKFAKPVVISELYEAKQKATTDNLRISGVVERNNLRKLEIEDFDEDTAQVENEKAAEIETVEERLKLLKAKLKEYKKTRAQEKEDLTGLCKDDEKFLSENEETPIEPIDLKIETAEDHNEKAAAVKKYLDSKEKLKAIEATQKKYNDQIAKAEKAKAELIQKSKLPIDGLTFTEDGLFLNEIPFAPGEVSTSQEMEVAAKLIIAKNPRVKVFRIAQGESLGKSRMKAIIDFANKHGYQGFIEEVKRGQDQLKIEEYTEGV